MKEKLIVMTGATRGLGLSLTREFVKAGRFVAGCGSNAALAAGLKKDFEGKADFECVDIRSDAAVASWAASVKARFGAPMLLINNAAVINERKMTWELSAREFDDLMQVNVNAAVNVIRHFVPLMIDGPPSVIVNMSSGWGRSVSSGVSAYCCSKWAIEALSKVLAEELPHGHAAVALNPGIINTDMLKSAFGSHSDDYENSDDWAKRAAPYILSLGAAHNGQSLNVPHP